MRNHLGEKEYATYSAWKRACRAVDANCRFEGNKDICQAYTADGKAIGQWYGDTGSIYLK